MPEETCRASPSTMFSFRGLVERINSPSLLAGCVLASNAYTSPSTVNSVTATSFLPSSVMTLRDSGIRFCGTRLYLRVGEADVGYPRRLRAVDGAVVVGYLQRHPTGDTAQFHQEHVGVEAR